VSIDATDMFGECYIRIYLVINQNGNTEKRPLGTFLLQTPQSDFDGKVSTVSIDAYTPLIELKENKVPIGYSVLKDSNILDSVYMSIKDNCRCPIVKTESDKTLYDDFVANEDDTYLTYNKDLLSKAKYSFDLNEMGKILFKPDQRINTQQPVYTFNDDNSSILYPDLKLKHDIYGIPNVIEVYYTIDNQLLYSIVKNEDPNSPISIPNRGREIRYRITKPNLPGIPTQEQIDEYAKDMLEQLSTVNYTVSFTHGYYPCRIGDCVRLNYKKAGLDDVKAVIISQDISCNTAVKVKSTAKFIKKLWG
jgi:hypothetical protein